MSRGDGALRSVSRRGRGQAKDEGLSGETTRSSDHVLADPQDGLDQLPTYYANAGMPTVPMNYFLNFFPNDVAGLRF